MSIINSDQYNADWQLRVLRGLQNLSDQLVILNASPSSNTPLPITPNILFESGSDGSLSQAVKSISFASTGTADALVSFDGGNNYTVLKAGTTVNMTAGSINNYYPGGLFYWDTTSNTGASLLITYNE